MSKCTLLCYIICVFRCVPTTRSHIFLCHRVWPLYAFLGPPQPSSLRYPPHCCYYRWVFLPLYVLFVHLLLSVLYPHLRKIIWFLTFSVWLILFSMVFSRSIHVITSGSTSPLLMSTCNFLLYVRTTSSLPTYLVTDTLAVSVSWPLWTTLQWT